jgi:hypothetical protein
MPSGHKGRGSRPDTTPARPASVPPPSSGVDAPPRSGEPLSGPASSSARPPAESVAWGGVRDAVTAMHNLEVLLKSPRVGTKLLGEVLHEFVTGASVLRAAFTSAAESVRDRDTSMARHALAAFTASRLDELERTMQLAVESEFDARGRLALEQVVSRVTVDLDAAAELLDLSERAERPSETDLTVGQLALVSLSGRARGTDREIAVRLVEPVGCEDHPLVRADPHVFKRLIAFCVARVHAGGADEVSARLGLRATSVTLEISATRGPEAALAAVRLRLVRRIDPTDAVVDAAAASAGIVLTSPSAGTIALEVPVASPALSAP